MNADNNPLTPALCKLMQASLILKTTDAKILANHFNRSPSSVRTQFQRILVTLTVVVVAALQPVSAGAQSKIVPVAAGSDLYPRLETPVQIQLGQRKISVRPLKTVRTPSGQEVVADRIIVAFRSGTSLLNIADAHLQAARRGAGVGRPLVNIGGASYLVDVTGAASLADAVQAYRADPRVRFAEADGVGHIDDVPNDPEIWRQSSLFRIDTQNAWTRTHSTPFGRIAILDTGINDTGSDAHPDLVGRVAASRNFTSYGPGGQQTNFDDVDDVAGHGTHVAGIAAAATNNGVGVAGIGYDTRLMNGKIALEDGRVAISMLSSGIFWAANNGATVINMSLSGPQDCNPNLAEDVFDIGRNELRDALGHAWSRNVVLVASAGNDNSTQRRWPGDCPNVLSVASVDFSDNRASDSSYGLWVDVAAPGVDIFSTAVPGAHFCGASNANFPYATCHGTSMAAPHVSGLAALVKYSCGLTNPQAVVDRITGNADTIEGTGSLWQFGRIDAARATCINRPTGVRVASIGATSITIEWGDSTPGDSSFEVAHRPSGGRWWTASIGPNNESWTLTGLATGQSYEFKVRTCDPVGCSDYSNSVTATTGMKRLTVSLSGKGKVTSSPGGINCGAGTPNMCSHYYAPGTVVSLTGTGYTNTHLGEEWMLDHWEGACTALSCTVTMSAARSVRAVFVKGFEP